MSMPASVHRGLASVRAAGSPVNDSRRGNGEGERWRRSAGIGVPDAAERSPLACLETSSASADNRRVAGHRG